MFRIAPELRWTSSEFDADANAAIALAASGRIYRVCSQGRVFVGDEELALATNPECARAAAQYHEDSLCARALSSQMRALAAASVMSRLQRLELAQVGTALDEVRPCHVEEITSLQDALTLLLDP